MYIGVACSERSAPRRIQELKHVESKSPGNDQQNHARDHRKMRLHMGRKDLLSCSYLYATVKEMDESGSECRHGKRSKEPSIYELVDRQGKNIESYLVAENGIGELEGDGIEEFKKVNPSICSACCRHEAKNNGCSHQQSCKQLLRKGLVDLDNFIFIRKIFWGKSACN